MSHYAPDLTGFVPQTATEATTELPREAKRTKTLGRSLPIGMTLGEYRDGRLKRFFVRYGPKRAIESFESEALRNDRAEKLAEVQEKEGSKALDFDPEEWRHYKRFINRTGATLQKLEQVWEAATEKQNSRYAVAEAVSRYLDLRIAEGLNKKGDTYRHIKKHLGRLVAAFGVRLLSDVSTEDLRPWFVGLKHPKTGKLFDKSTVRNHRKDINLFFERCVDEEWLAKNPCAKIKPPKVLLKDKPPMPVRDIFELLKANRDEPVAGRLALEIFGSLRCSSVARCQETWIVWDRKGIRLPGADAGGEEQLHKSGKTLFRQGHPEVLWAWLKHSSPAMWEVTESMYPHRKGQAFIRAKVKNPGNGLRRSCASYQLALTKNVGPVSYLMQHKHTSTTEIYEGMADEKDARLFMLLTPDAVKTDWDKFVQINETKSEPPP